MLRYALRRLALAIPLMLGVATLVFILMESAPGDPVDLVLGDRPVPDEVRERIERAYGFDRPAPERYARWLGALVFEGELGWSHSRTRPVSRALADALPPTLLLSAAAMIFYLGCGVALGAWSASRRGGWQERLVTYLSLATYSMPVFWLGLMAVWLLSYRFGLFPASSMSRVDAAFAALVVARQQTPSWPTCWGSRVCVRSDTTCCSSGFCIVDARVRPTSMWTSTRTDVRRSSTGWSSVLGNSRRP